MATSTPSKASSVAYLSSLLNKTLRITTSDTRLFLGEFKCTDAENNTILSRTYEYRPPPPPTPSRGPSPSHQETKVTQDMTSRYLGLVVIPGAHIVKIEVEEFASQVPKEGSRWLRGPEDVA